MRVWWRRGGSVISWWTCTASKNQLALLRANFRGGCRAPMVMSRNSPPNCRGLVKRTPEFLGLRVVDLAILLEVRTTRSSSVPSLHLSRNVTPQPKSVPTHGFPFSQPSRHPYCPFDVYSSLHMRLLELVCPLI